MTEGDNPVWTLQSDEFYVRDVSGKEIAIYSGSSLTQWNIWGLDNVGKINADTTRNYYLKDHLGSIRVVLNSTNGIISAQDYDAWGYPLENRSYQSTNTLYKFTGKERDNETSYDYFGARYYDSRIGRWGAVEPLLDKYPGATPYCYSLNNPTLFKDFDGFDLTLGGDKGMALNDLKSMFVDESMQNRITADDNGVVSFDVNGIDVSSDAATELLNNLVGSKETYLYEVADVTTSTIRTTSDFYTKGEAFTENLNKLGFANYSKTPRNINGGTGNADNLPKEGYSGQVTLGTGNWTNKGETKGPYQDRWNFVFHELAENYNRTEKFEPYMRQNGSGAHQKAIDYSKGFKRNTSATPGEAGTYVPKD